MSVKMSGKKAKHTTGENTMGAIDNNNSDGVTHVHLAREITFLHAVSVMTGVMIGSGIFVSPVSVIYHCGSVALSLIIWVLSGFLMMCIALSYAELGAMFPSSGGEYSYDRLAIGDLPAFMFAWYVFVLANPAFYALLALTTAIYIFYPLFPDCQAPDLAIRTFAITIVLIVAYLNCVYVRYVTRVQTFLAATKFVALIIIAISGMVAMAKGHTDILQMGFHGSTSDPGGIAIAMYSGVFTYGGWQYLFALLEEVKNPAKIIPRVSITSFVLVIIVYTLTNVAYFSVLTPEEMLRSEAVAMSFAEKAIGGFSMAIPFFVACSTVGALNGSMLGGSRIYFAAARDGLFPSAMSMISVHYQTPIPSVLITCGMTVIYIVIGDAVALLEYLGFAAALNGMTSCAIVLYLKRSRPDMPRPYKVNLCIPIGVLVVIIPLAVLGIIHDPYKNGIGILLVLTGIPVYWIFITWKRKPKMIQNATDKFSRVLQKLFIVLPE